MCGEHRAQSVWLRQDGGSSPHVRGARHGDARPAAGLGIIPACAGSTKAEWTDLISRGDHPRMCGEHEVGFEPFPVLAGSSPHVRGARWSRWPDASRCGIIPACAGSTMLPARCPVRARDHPRMCGEHKDVTTEQIVQAGSSPHVRGAPEVTAGNSRTNGIIPACAGST